ncbi:hypothetical protein EJ02DRAFT_340265 [Clathrospora elynae]|uniref:Zn(2)-C6 fungal-type domain-containing protein n=1 Tax=Clathrospora elynae TaxID=706981 RepID=A0A6A5SZB8_9PLEO|nr:hypothetical protein EJ02DRAFT_340265 [Clathrospora elynae]
MPRLGHKKSRLGCRQCKTRHVKCDELKPCSSCARHGVPCSLITWDPDAPPSPAPAASAGSSSTSGRAYQPSTDQSGSSSTSSTSSPSLLIDHALNPLTTPSEPRTSVSAVAEKELPASQEDEFPFLTRFMHRDEASQSDIWLRDLELLHHWTTEAYGELSQREDMRQVWMIDGPQQAVKHAFMMHEILAFAAFHKAHKEKELEKCAEYYAFGVHHQDLAIRGIRERLHNVTTHEAAAIVATSTLLTLSVFASTGFEAKFAFTATTQDAIDGIVNIFNLMQGMGNVLALAQKQVMESFLAPMFKDSVESIPSQPMLQELLQHIPTLVTFVEGKRDLSEHDRKLYLDTIAHFNPGLQMSMPPRVDNRELRFLFFWPLHLSSTFLSYVRQRQPGALVILMYYTTILYASEPRYFFMEGWSERLMKSLYEGVDQSWVSVIQWPISFLNQVASWTMFTNFLRYKEGASMHTPYTKQPPVSIPHRQPHVGPSQPYEHSSGIPYAQQMLATIPAEDQKPRSRMFANCNSVPSTDDAA